MILHIFSGPDTKYWEKQCASADTEILCVDTEGPHPANLLDKNVYGYLLSLCASGRVKAIIGGPPCRTLTALRYQNDGGPGVLRDDEHPYGRPELSLADAALVEGDTLLMFRFLSLLVLSEDVRAEDDEPTAFLLEQPEDPARYRSSSDVAAHGYFSFFRTKEWKNFETKYHINQIHMDQHPMGHKKRKPTTLATNLKEMFQLDGLRGEPDEEARATEAFRAMPLPQRMQESKSWSCWADGLKAAISTALCRHMERLAGEVLPAVQQPILRPLSQLALEAWKQHFLHDHLPARRDCVHCVRAQGRSRPHRRITHPDAFTLSVDLSGKMVVGKDQGGDRCRYIMVACYTFPVTGDGRPLIEPPGVSQEDRDHPLPSMDLHGGGGPDLHDDQPLPSMDLHGGGGPDQVCQDQVFDDDDVVMDEMGAPPPMPESAADVPDPPDPLQEQSQPEFGPDGPAEASMRSAFDVWHRLVHDAPMVGVKNLTFTEVISSRAVKDVMPALARIYARLRYLGLPVHRIHCDRARELTSAAVRRWTLDRGIITTLTTGSTYKTNGRVESEVGAVKRAVRTLISAQLCPLESWPLALRHVGERRLRSQLQAIGWPVAPLLKFGVKAFALKKSWQDRYHPWRDVREEVIVLGPDKCSSFTTTNYYVQSIATGRYFYTDDVLETATVPSSPEPAEPILFLPERQEVPPILQDGVPTRRLRGKTAVPAVRSMMNIEGEKEWGSSFESGAVSHKLVGGSLEIPDHLKSHFEMDDVDGSDEFSWTLGTDSDQTSASSRAEAETPTLQSDADVAEEGVSGGDVEGAPKYRCGGACPVASLSGVAAIRTIHGNVTNFIQEEMACLDATSGEQSMWLGAVTDAIALKSMLEDQLQEAQHQKDHVDQRRLEQEFLITKTISNNEVWSHLDDWRASIEAEFEQLVKTKKAVRQVAKSELHRLAQEAHLPIELLPAKMVHTRKAGSGAYRSRAVVCGNYEHVGEDDRYAGGADGNQIRAQVRLASSKRWAVCGTDIRVAFLNAPKRDETKITAMEVPTVFRKLGLAGSDDVWIIQKAVYGLTSSPRDWCLYRDETLPTMSWRRLREGHEVEGRFVRTPDDNVWRLEEADQITGEKLWTGLMTVYVDDLLVTAEDEATTAAISAIAKVWAISEVEKAGVQTPVKYCGFEIEVPHDQDGYILHQRKYEKEMTQRWDIHKAIDVPNFKLSDAEEEPADPIDQNQIKTAQAMAGALLWLNTRTRPDISVGVSMVCRLATKNPAKSIEVGKTLMEYIKGNPGGLRYFSNAPSEMWGERGQLKIARSAKLLEVFSDIGYGTASRGRSLQGTAVFFGGSIICWQTAVQPFVTHSTAESELVGYCDALNTGRSAEAMLANMMGVPSGSPAIERVLYGDNTAAIGLAHGTSSSSWRTRHLKIRAAYVREALEGRAPGGLWRLLHLRGVDLVADGLTKPLSGQAFEAFLVDLGMRRHRDETEPQEDGPPSAALAAMMAGSFLLSGMDAAEETEGDIWACGAVLMAFGAIYVGQLAVKTTKCCLRRLQGPLQSSEEDNRRQPLSNANTGTAALTGAQRGTGSSSSKRSATSLNITIRSGSQHGDSSSSSSLPSSSNGDVTGSADARSSSATKTSKGRAFKSSSAVRGESKADGASRTSSSSGTAAVSRASAAAEAFGTSASSSGTASGSGEVRDLNLSNPWNKFQHEHAGQGFSKQTLSKLYQYEKNKDL